MSATELRTVPLDAIVPDPLQPRVNVSVDLVRRLSESMKAGRHEPLIEAERISGAQERYQILCGEQRWRAAREAGMTEVLVRVHRRLGYLDRIRKQYEENHLRADLDPAEDGALVLAVKTLKDIAVAERLLRDALVPFQPLEDKRLGRREEIGEHLEELRRLLRKNQLEVEQLSPWSETERALGISETRRKAKVAVLRLDPDLQDAVRDLPAEHALQISRIPDRERQEQLIERARGLSHKEVHAAVERLRDDASLTVDEALASEPPGDSAFDGQLATLGDLCRQLVRLVTLLREDSVRRRLAVPGLRELRAVIDGVLETA